MGIFAFFDHRVVFFLFSFFSFFPNHFYSFTQLVLFMKLFFALLAASLLIAGCVSNPPSTPAVPSLSSDESLERLDALSRKLFSNSSNASFSYATATSALFNGNALPDSNLTVYWSKGDFRLVERPADGKASETVLVGNETHFCTREGGLNTCTVSKRVDQANALFFKAILGRLGAAAAGKPADAVETEHLGYRTVANRSCELFKITVDGSKVEELAIDSNAFIETTASACLDSEFGVALSSYSETHVKVIYPQLLAQGQADAYARFASGMNEELLWFDAAYSGGIKAP